ncbi:MAG: hypothetical protein Q8P01_01420 [bacterium]|nr:hypothetical protein [bacterium]
MFTEKVLPTVYEPDGGEKLSVAACAENGARTNSAKEKIIV